MSNFEFKQHGVKITKDIRLNFSSFKGTLRELADTEEDHSNISEEESVPLKFIRDWEAGQQEFVVMTSGSTGEPKRITMKRDHMVNSARRTGAFFNLLPEIMFW